MILILGNGALANSLEKILSNTKIVGKPDYDFSKQQDCDKLVETYFPDVVINTVGILSDNYWDTLNTNYVSTVYLTIKFYEKLNKAHIINISSASAFWPSYPGIDNKRFCYNLSKEALTSFGRFMNRKIIDDTDKQNIVTTVEPGSFSSKLNNFTPGRLTSDQVAELIKQVVNNPVAQISLIK
jgi:short-subunit dehydrogenase